MIKFPFICCLLLAGESLEPAFAQSSPVETNQFEYDAEGKLTRHTDGRGIATSLQYDGLGRLVRQFLPPSETQASQPTIQFDYDFRDQLIRVRDPGNLATQYTIDGLGDPVAQNSPDTGSTRRTFDESGNLVSSRDARGFVTRFEYDALHRITRIDYLKGVATTFTYDGASSGETGRLTKMTDSSGETIYDYDEVGRLTGKTQFTANGSRKNKYQLVYQYGNAGPSTGKIIGITYPSGNRVGITYGADGKVNALTLEPVGGGSATSILSELQYEPFGPPLSWKWGGAGGQYLRRFDAGGRLVQLPLGSPQSGGVLRTIKYDESGRIQSYKHTGTNGASTTASRLDQTFTYDNLNRLRTFQTADTQQAFEYDLNGNRTKTVFGNNAYTSLVDRRSNRTLSANGPAPAKSNSYDATGNLLSDGERVFKYDERGRLASVRMGVSTTSYSYNGIGERVQKSGAVALVSGGAVQYFYDVAGNMLGEYDASGRMIEETIFLEGVAVAVMKPSSSIGAQSLHLFHVFADHLATPRVITNSRDGKIVWRWDNSDPFGMVAPMESVELGSAFTYNRRFPGQYYDKETNLHYNYFRDYDPQTGRYLQSDPIGLAGGINTYSYVGGNPVARNDPFGLWATGAHNYFIDQVFRHLDPAIRDIIKNGSAHADTMQFQDPAHSHMHAMSSDVMNPEAAKRAMCRYIKGMMSDAKDAKQMNDAKYWFYLGMALHPVMDSTSPAHSGFQRWNGIRADGSKHGPFPSSLETESIARQPGHTKRTVDAMRRALAGDLGGCGCN